MNGRRWVEEKVGDRREAEIYKIMDVPPLPPQEKRKVDTTVTLRYLREIKN